MSKVATFLLILSFFTATSLAEVTETPAANRKVRPDTNSETKTQSKEQKVTFNFVDVELPVVTKFISEITKKNFVFDERVKGKITIIAPSEISINDAYNLFLSVLELKGFTIVPSGINAYKIVPSSEARQRGIKIEKDREPVNESYIAQLIPLKHISSEEAIRFIQPLVSRDGYSSAFGPGNLLLVIDSGLNIKKILNVIEAIDQPSTDISEIVYLKHASADSVAKIINEVVGKKVLPHGTTVVPMAVADTRLNAVILFGDKGTRKVMSSIIDLVDLPSPETLGRINVYFLENADATEMAKSLENVIKASQQQRPSPTAPGPPAVTPFEAAGAINITADKATNALIIVASPSDYQNLLQVIKQLDKRRRQVYVEAMIVEASMEKIRELGSRWRVIARSNGEPVAIGGFGTLTPEAFLSIIEGLEGITLGGMGNFLKIPVITTDGSGKPTITELTVPGFAALFSLDEFKDAVNVLSIPQILTSDNKEAEIVVGENVPFISKRERDLTTTGTVLSSIERMDVGIKLGITPQITEGDYVKLDIYQEISSIVEKQSENILINVGPTTTKRSTKTSVVVKDGETVVIGGLMQEKDEEDIRKAPILGDIPLLGWLFKYKGTSKKKTNLLVFLTPHIVKDSERLTKITEEKRKEMAINNARYVEGEVIVKFREGVSDERAREIIKDEKAVVLRVIGEGKYHIRLHKDDDVMKAIERLSRLPEVSYAEPNYILRGR